VLGQQKRRGPRASKDEAVGLNKHPRGAFTQNTSLVLD